MHALSCLLSLACLAMCLAMHIISQRFPQTERYINPLPRVPPPDSPRLPFLPSEIRYWAFGQIHYRSLSNHSQYVYLFTSPSRPS